MGHTSIGYIAGEQVKNKDISFMAYKDCLNKYGLEYKDQWVIREKYFEVYSGYECMKKLLNSAELPTAIFCYTDSMAVGAMKACREKGLVIPEDISIIGCNNDDISQFVEPQIATIMNPVETICKFAVKAVHELINKNKSDNHLIQLKIPMEFIERKSVKNLADMKNKNK
jgi:DNA-binding LacI/PurR family transcriptional regulator